MCCLCWNALAADGVAASSDDRQSETPELAVLDLDSNRRSLTELRGKVVLVNFWTSWCPPCISEMPALKRLSRSLADERFALLAINVGEGRGVVQRFASLEEAGISLLRDVEGDLARQWGVKVYPTSVILDGNGHRLATIIGETDWDTQARQDQLRALIQAGATKTTN